MSFSELAVVLIVAIFVMKPKDIAILVKKVRQIKSGISSFKNDIISYLEEIIDIDEKKQDSVIDTDNKQEINLYLQRILALGGSYNGNYSSDDIKKAYHKLLFKIATEEKARYKQD